MKTKNSNPGSSGFEFVTLLNLQAILLDTSDFLLNISGYNRDDLLGKSVFDFIHPEDLSSLQKDYREIFTTNKIETPVYRFRKKNGGYFCLKSKAEIIDRDDAKLIHVVSINLSDVIEDIVHQKSSLLTGEIKKRETALAMEDKMNSIGILAGWLSHDLNNIIMGIRGNLYVAKKMTSDNQLIRLLNDIEENTSRAAMVTQQLLGYARKGMYEKKPLNFYKIITNAWQTIPPDMKKNITLDQEKPHPGFEFYGSADQIYQVFLNVFLNAVQAMPAGGKCSLTMDKYSPGEEFLDRYPFVHKKDFIRIIISDTGTGMTEDVLEHIFQPFYSGRKKGLGLGMSMVYGVVKNHNGYIIVESTPGAGSTVILLFKCGGEPISYQIQPDNKDVITGDNKSQYNILIVEDDIIIREMAELVLSQFGHHVYTASNGKEAMEFAASDVFYRLDFVLLDMTMPCAPHGDEVLKRFRELRDDLHVAVMTGYFEEDELQDILNRKNVLFLRKPFKVNDMLEIINRSLNS